MWRLQVIGFIALLGPRPALAASVDPPPNEPADVRLDGATVELRYQGALIFAARVKNPEAVRVARPGLVRRGDAVDQAVVWSARGSDPIEIEGTVTASGQSFPCESDRPLRGVPVVRHSSGLSRSLLNQAVYDRQWDWVLSVDDQPHTRVRVTPGADTPASRTFAFEARGDEIVLRFRPRFYQKHRGLERFEPWTYTVWPKPIVGWCSWFAFLDKVTEGDVKKTADVLSEVLLPYGYEYLQIDDGYQRGTGRPELWLNANAKFPAGLPALASYIKQKGLKPGLWTNATFSETEFAQEHTDWFVRDAAGEVARGNWIEHPVDASVPAALEALVRPIYRSLREMGWDYFKLDALRHLRYEGYNTFRDHFARKGVAPGDAFRQYVASVRQEIGGDRFLLACWGARPELVGLVDGCRLGTDGFSYAGLAQFNSFNNVVWRNDPDHVELSEAEAWRSTLVTSLTGSMLLLTDQPEKYRSPLVEAAKRTSPVLVTVPGQLYDVDPSRSSELWRVDGEFSGRDPKPFDASLTTPVHLYALEINRPFESWTVLGRTGGDVDQIRFEDLGLDPAKEYEVFDFWPRRALGHHKGSFAPGPLPTAFHSQAFVIRERLDRPQVLATGRHVTGGGVDLQDVRWKAGVLSGRSQVIGGDPYDLFLTEPAGWTLHGIDCQGGTPLAVEHRDGVAKTGCRSATSREVAWSARFTSGERPPR